jgi:ribosomal protein S18 acetylase RimI-like enzyme
MKTSYNIRRLNTLNEMLQYHALIQQLYPKMSLQQYESLLKEMIPHHYYQIGVFEDEKIVGISGYWLSNRLWCGKYMDIDNVVVDENYRSLGIGKLMMQWLHVEAEKQQCNIAVLDVYVENFNAHRFYYRQDYVARGYHFTKDLRLPLSKGCNLWKD